MWGDVLRTDTVQDGGSLQLRAPSLASRPYPWGFSPYCSMSVMKIAELAAAELWIMLRMVLPTDDTSSRAPRSWGLVAPVSGLGVNRMFP